VTPDMAAGGRIGIYGGTFDPVHVGHLVAATEVQAALALDRVVFMPAGHPPHKPEAPISPAEHRVRMLELAIEGRPWFSVSRLDLAGRGPSYTADLLARAREEFAGLEELCFIMGEDMLRSFATWHEPARVARLARLAVVTRPNVDVDLDAVARAVPAVAGRVDFVAIPQIDVSSSDLRERVAAGRPIAFQTPRAVEDYILANGLYRG
jgi:nicotinate-nucleotide adenylyltransferase